MNKEVKKLDITNQNIISVIIVAQNDSQIIGKFLHDVVENLQNYENFEIVVVDNGSLDRTVEMVRDLQKDIPQIRLLVLSQNYGVEVALSAGLDNSIGDFVVMINTYTDPPKLIPTIVEKVSTEADIVFARPKSIDKLVPNFLARLLIGMVGVLSKHNQFFSLNYFSGFNRSATNAITRVKRKKRHLGYINSLIGFKRVEIAYNPQNRYLEKSKQISIFKLISILVDAVITNSFRLLRFMTFVGVLASLINLFFLVYIVFVTLVKKNIVEGWISTNVIMSTMFFLLFVILTVIAEYLLRILYEVRDEPAYFIAEEYDSSMFNTNKDKLNVTTL